MTFRYLPAVRTEAEIRETTEAETSGREMQISDEWTATHKGFAEFLLAVYGGYCEAMFESLATMSPHELASIVRQGRAEDSRLTFAVEILGRDVREPWVAGDLIKVLGEHRSPVVREGAALGLAHQMERQGAREALRKAAAMDPSEGVRATARDILDNE